MRTEDLIHTVPGLREAILSHPFLLGLAAGDLPEACFQYYALQDSLYLRSFGKGLALLAARSPGDGDRALLCRHAATAVEVERSLHAGFLSSWNLSERERKAPASPTTELYSSFLGVAAAQAPFPVAVCAFLPCYWIYHDVGRVLHERGSPHPLYARWIATYADPAFGSVVQEMRGVCDRALASASAEEHRLARIAFQRASQLEWRFWDAAWRRETWEPPLPDLP